MSDPGRTPAAGESAGRPATSVLVNATANVAGQAVALLAGVVCAPLYLRLLGAEALGLIGFSLALQAVVRMLDFGMASAVLRQTARLAGRPGGELAGFFVTFERLFGGAAAVIGAVTVALAPLIASRWLHGQHLSPAQIVVAVAAIGAQAALLFMGTLYHGALMGLERQVQFNRIRVVEALASQFGAVLLLAVWARRVEVLFGWQLAVALAALIAYARTAAGALPAGRAGARFSLAHVRAVWPFAVGMAGITATGTVLTYMDKVLLSRWLRLDAFGYYTLAFYAASLVSGLLVAPVFNALYPRTCALVERADAAGEQRLYHLALQGLVVLVWPLAAILWVFAQPVLQLWIGDTAAAAAAGAVLPYLVAGVALNTAMVPAYMLQLAHAWTALGVVLNVVLIALFAPLLFVLAGRWGVAGAAANFALLQGAYLLVGMPLTHRRLLKGALAEVALRDVLPGLALCALAVAALTPLRDAVAAAAPVPRYLTIAAAWATLTAGTALLSSRVRPVLLWRRAPFSES